MSVLVTGGAGFIGSHTCIDLLESGYDVVVADNLCNSSKESLKRVEAITGQQIAFYECDLLDKEKLREIFKEKEIVSVIHFAGLKAVGESVEKPYEYYWNNLVGTLNLYNVMCEFDVKKLVFSSSATVYGNPHTVPIREDFPLSVTNPYGRTKLMIEDMLKDFCKADPSLSVYLLRYFNPIGAHESGTIGEDPEGIPNNLVPYITQAALGKFPHVRVFGDDYETPDGTGVRDYIHVMDLAVGHVKALDRMESCNPGVYTYNLGTGQGYSVLDIIRTFSKTTGKDIPYQIYPRRSGDIAACYADASKAKAELGWEAKRDLAQMCEDAWKWQKNNPRGFKGDAE